MSKAEESQVELDALKTKDASKSSNTFLREEGKESGLETFNNQYGSLDDYTAEAGVAIKFTSKRNRHEMITRTLVDSKTKHSGMQSEFNRLQDKNVDVDILINEAGKRAEMGEQCHISEEVAIGRAGDLVLA